MRNNPMPIELVLAAHDFETPCLMSIMHGCDEQAEFLVYITHKPDGTPLCGGISTLPLCKRHKIAVVFISKSSPLGEVLNAPVLEPCDECGKDITVQKVTTLRGEVV